ncbi:MAG: hypothetical protein IJ829_07150, partial [Kiritimatiellae bacterium]|nr:hypothetical protein [Kiritimatiellia bacterium]
FSGFLCYYVHGKSSFRFGWLSWGTQLYHTKVWTSLFIGSHHFTAYILKKYLLGRRRADDIRPYRRCAAPGRGRGGNLPPVSQ